MYQMALKHREERTTVAHDMETFENSIKTNPGFIKAMWCEDRACEDKIKEVTGATLRCMPFEQDDIGSDTCVCCGKKAKKLAYFARAY